MLDLKKALDTTAGSALIPEKIDPELIELANKMCPLRTLIKRINWSTNAYEWNDRTALGTARAYDESDTFNAANSTYGRRTVSIKMIESEGSVSGLLLKVGKDLLDPWASEIEGATESLAQLEEKIIIQGDATSAPKEFNGLRKQITQEVDLCGNSLGTSAGLDALDKAISDVENNGGRPGLIVLSARDKLSLDKYLRTVYQYVWEKVDVAPGIRLVAYKGIPVYVSAYVPTDVADGATPTGAASYALVLDRSKLIMAVAKDFGYEEVSVTNDARAFRVNAYEALAVKGAGHFHSVVINIAE